LSSSTAKKVFIRRFDREPLTGFVNLASYLQPGGIELLTPSGALNLVPYDQIKVVCFVKDFDAVETAGEKRVFTARPKLDGLWVRMVLRDGEIMEGVHSNDLLQIGATGFTLTPPDPFANNQRLFVPRAALREIQVLGVVGSPLTRRKKKEAPSEQIGLFEQPPE